MRQIDEFFLAYLESEESSENLELCRTMYGGLDTESYWKKLRSEFALAAN
jgi:hypothetical protein